MNKYKAGQKLFAKFGDRKLPIEIILPYYYRKFPKFWEKKYKYLVMVDNRKKMYSWEATYFRRDLEEWEIIDEDSK